MTQTPDSKLEEILRQRLSLPLEEWEPVANPAAVTAEAREWLAFLAGQRKRDTQ